MCEVEEIPDGDNVSRLVEAPRTYDAEKHLILEAIFEFMSGYPESLVWRQYAQTDKDVHAKGAEWETAKRQRKPEMRYAGFITSQTRDVRNITTARGHGFVVEHKPREGRHHAEVRYRTPYEDLTRIDKNELKLFLRQVFGPLSEAP